MLKKDDELIANYIGAAKIHCEATNNGNSDAANVAYDTIIETLDELRKQPDKGHKILSALLNHDDLSVRVWAATHLLPLDEPKAIDSLSVIADKSGIIAFDAKMVLEEWRLGRLKVP